MFDVLLIHPTQSVLQSVLGRSVFSVTFIHTYPGLSINEVHNNSSASQKRCYIR